MKSPRRSLALLLALVVSLAGTATPIFAQGTTGQVKPGINQTIVLNAYADNWCAIFINGKLVATDSIDFLPHNQVSVKILPEYPMTIAVIAKDNADPKTGLEYGTQLGDGGLILKLGDGTVTNATWKAKAFFRGPTNRSVTNPIVEYIDIPANWYAIDFDDSAWSNATEYATETVKPDGDYVAADFTNAKFIWTADLFVDNTVIFRTTVQKPANYVKAWNTTPDLDISKFPSELGATVTTVTPTDTGSGQLANLSARAQVGSGDGVLIPGLVITGATSRRVLVRAVGPGLAQFGVTGFLADPVLTAFKGTTTLATNDNWEQQSAVPAISVATATTQAATFALTAGSKDSALVLTLDPGAYTFRVAGAGGTTGVALVEVYLLP